MKERFRIEIYDENKENDLTIYSEQGIDKDYLVELVFSNRRRFAGNIKAYVFDIIKKKKITATRLDMEFVNQDRPKILTGVEIGLS